MNRTDPFPSRRNTNDRFRCAASAWRCRRRSRVSSACAGATCANTCAVAFAKRSASRLPAMSNSNCLRLGLLGLVQFTQPAEHGADRPCLVDADLSRRRCLRHVRMLGELFGLVQHAGGFPFRQAALHRQPRRGRCPAACCSDSCAASAFASSTADRAVNRDARRPCQLGTLQPLTTAHQAGIEPVKAALDPVQHPPRRGHLLLHGTSQTPATDINRTGERLRIVDGAEVLATSPVRPGGSGAAARRPRRRSAGRTPLAGGDGPSRR